MFKSFSFEEASDFLHSCELVVGVLEPILGESGMCMLHDALSSYALAPDFHGCPEDDDMARIFALALHKRGYNHLRSDVDASFYLRISARTVFIDRGESADT